MFAGASRLPYFGFLDTAVFYHASKDPYDWFRVRLIFHTNWFRVRLILEFHISNRSGMVHFSLSNVSITVLFIIAQGEARRNRAAQAAAKSPAPHRLLLPGRQSLFPQCQAWPIFGRGGGSGSGDERWRCREEGAAAIYLSIHLLL